MGSVPKKTMSSSNGFCTQNWWDGNVKITTGSSICGSMNGSLCFVFQIESVKLDFRDKAQSKVGSKDNMKHQAGGGDKKVRAKTSQKFFFILKVEGGGVFNEVLNCLLGQAGKSISWYTIGDSGDAQYGNSIISYWGRPVSHTWND